MNKTIGGLAAIVLSSLMAIGVARAEDTPPWVGEQPYERDGFYYANGTSEWSRDEDTARAQAVERASTEALYAFGEVEIQIDNEKSSITLFDDGDEEYSDSTKQRANSRIVSRILKRDIVSQYPHKKTGLFPNSQYKTSVLIKIDKRDIVSNRFEEDSRILREALELGYRERQEFKNQIERESEIKIEEKDKEVIALRKEKTARQERIYELERERRNLASSSDEKDKRIERINKELAVSKRKNERVQKTIERIEAEREAEIQELKEEVERLEEIIPHMKANKPVDIPGFAKASAGVTSYNATLTKASSDPNREEDDTATFAGGGFTGVYRFFFVPSVDISAQLTLANIERYEDNYRYKRVMPASGDARSIVLGTNYNFGNSVDSWLGRWWTIYIGLGLAMGNTSVALDGEDYNWQTSGLTVNFGFDYRFENNVTVGLHAYSTTSKAKYNDAQMSANFGSGSFVIGYLY